MYSFDSLACGDHGLFWGCWWTGVGKSVHIVMDRMGQAQRSAGSWSKRHATHCSAPAASLSCAEFSRAWAALAAFVVSSVASCTRSRAMRSSARMPWSSARRACSCSGLGTASEPPGAAAMARGRALPRPLTSICGGRPSSSTRKRKSAWPSGSTGRQDASAPRCSRAARWALLAAILSIPAATRAAASASASVPLPESGAGPAPSTRSSRAVASP
mmetsp:Transcript_22685/g.72680  ORF Transcript_22685/g.72680 Transcript_22685/m.72680 type:complete len:216 (+) Transcript_22685:650-1297(+)